MRLFGLGKKKQLEEAKKPTFRRSDIVALKEDYYDEDTDLHFYKDDSAKVLATGENKLVVLFGYFSSCPYRRHKVTLSADKVELM